MSLSSIQSDSSIVYSFIIPIYNEQKILPELHRRLTLFLQTLDAPWEVILVDDGSQDNSFAQMLAIHANDNRFKLIQFSRNYGHQIAITAGMDLCQGKAVIIMDADLQDPPEVVTEMIARWKEGYDIVYGVRKKRLQETFFKKASASLFYRILRKITDIDMPRDVGDFRLVDRRALEAFKALREKNRYVRGIFSWVGFKQIGVLYKRDPRFAGTTKYSFKKMFKLATDAFIGFSILPLHLTMSVGTGMVGLSVIFLLYQLWTHGLNMAGFSRAGTVVAVLFFLSGIQLMLLGVLAEYIRQIHDEVKKRPLYIASELKGFSPVERDTVQSALLLPKNNP